MRFGLLLFMAMMRFCSSTLRALDVNIMRLNSRSDE